PDGETTVLSFNPDRSDWPRQTSFVVFFRNLLERARNRRAAGGVAPGSLGEALRIAAADGEEVVVTTPSGDRRTAYSRGGVAVVPVVAEPGVYQVVAEGRSRHALRSLLDRSESNIRPRARFSEGGAATEGQLAEVEEHAESFLVKRDRGRVNHVDRDQGLAYWFRMNNNADHDLSIQPRRAMMEAELARMMADPEIAAAHIDAVKQHRAKISALRARPDYDQFYRLLTGNRLQALSRLHRHFGANVFLSGPDVIPDDILSRDPDEDWFFTVNRDGDTAH
ncbi:MAG: hypothetical protein AAFY14_15775, partial [Pseudomonadota bacterium]